MKRITKFLKNFYASAPVSYCVRHKRGHCSDNETIEIISRHLKWDYTSSTKRMTREATKPILCGVKNGRERGRQN